DIGTDLWDPGKTIIELSELPWSPPADSGTEGALRFTLLLYDAETLEPLQIARAGGLGVGGDGATLLIPVQGPQP
ncbi:MAG: hypothetical protein ACRC1H_06570, partial [Caldilineaceae bacterium]